MPRKSILFLEFEKHLQKITELKKEGKSARAIFLQLQDEGLPGSKDSFRKWFNRMFPDQDENRKKRGRPKGKLIRSLGMLDADKDSDRPELLYSGALLILTPFSNNPLPESFRRLALGDYGINVPFCSDFEPDFHAYAKQLGARRVKTLGDMDYYLLARWTRELREKVAKTKDEAEALNLTVLHRAREIRSQMLEAVKPTRRRLKKK